MEYIRLNSQRARKIEHKLGKILIEYEKIQNQLNDQTTNHDHHLVHQLNKRSCYLQPMIDLFNQYQSLKKQYQEDQILLKDSDPEIVQLTKEQLSLLQEDLEKSLAAIMNLLVDSSVNSFDALLTIIVSTLLLLILLISDLNLLHIAL